MWRKQESRGRVVGQTPQGGVLVFTINGKYTDGLAAAISQVAVEMYRAEFNTTPQDTRVTWTPFDADMYPGLAADNIGEYVVKAK